MSPWQKRAGELFKCKQCCVHQRPADDPVPWHYTVPGPVVLRTDQGPEAAAAYHRRQRLHFLHLTASYPTLPFHLLQKTKKVYSGFERLQGGAGEGSSPAQDMARAQPDSAWSPCHLLHSAFPCLRAIPGCHSNTSLMDPKKWFQPEDAPITIFFMMGLASNTGGHSEVYASQCSRFPSTAACKMESKHHPWPAPDLLTRGLARRSEVSSKSSAFARLPATAEPFPQPLRNYLIATPKIMPPW